MSGQTKECARSHDSVEITVGFDGGIQFTVMDERSPDGEGCRMRQTFNLLAHLFYHLAPYVFLTLDLDKEKRKVRLKKQVDLAAADAVFS